MSYVAEPLVEPHIRKTPRQMSVWWNWPLWQRAPWSIAVVVAVVLASWFMAYKLPNGWAGAAAISALFLSLWRFFLPVRYKLSPTGLEISVFNLKRFVPWRNIHCFEVRSGGLMLYRQSFPAPLDALKAVFLPWGQRRAEVLESVAHCLESLQMRKRTQAHVAKSGSSGAE